MNAFWFLLPLILCLTVVGQELVEISAFGESSSYENGTSVAVHVGNGYLKNISLSLLMAETWVRTHVLVYYPTNNVTTIVLGQNVLCNKNQETKWGLISPAVKNIHYSLTRWGLQNDIKVSVYLDSNCLDPKSEKHIKSVLNTLLDIKSPYVVMSDENVQKSHFKFMKFPDFDKISVMSTGGSIQPSTFRKLLDIDYTSVVDPFPPTPTPLIGLVSPAPSPFVHHLPHVAPTNAPFAHRLPHLAPTIAPFGPHLPPCDPSKGGGLDAPTPHAQKPPARVYHGVWCVAKPSVPPETLQEALDYACGEGGADCEAIKPQGSCYYPDTVLAHASYAFNSYWQKNKSNGGSCGFGGTAMLITTDPSYQQCRFILA